MRLFRKFPQWKNTMKSLSSRGLDDLLEFDQFRRSSIELFHIASFDSSFPVWACENYLVMKSWGLHVSRHQMKPSVKAGLYFTCLSNTVSNPPIIRTPAYRQKLTWQAALNRVPRSSMRYHAIAGNRRSYEAVWSPAWLFQTTARGSLNLCDDLHLRANFSRLRRLIVHGLVPALWSNRRKRRDGRTQPVRTRWDGENNRNHYAFTASLLLFGSSITFIVEVFI